MEIYTYSIIIPAYNEAQRITASLERILAHIAKEHWSAEILVVNDGSRDNTAEIVREFATTSKSVRLIENPGNRGKGFSVRNGMLHALGDVLLFTDADLSSPIEEAAKLFAAIDGGADVAIGSRWINSSLQTEKQPLYRQFFGRMFNLLLRMILGLKYKDTQCGFKAFTREAATAIFSKQKIDRWGFDPEVLYLARKFGYQIREVPVAWGHDTRSKINPVVDGFRMLMEMLRIRWDDISGKYDEKPSRVTVG